MKVNVDFSGGLELQFAGRKHLTVDVPEQTTAAGLIEHLRKNELKDKEEMFVQQGTVRPGILVMINDTDWELEGTLDYKIQPNDTIAFISTLHGG